MCLLITDYLNSYMIINSYSTLLHEIKDKKKRFQIFKSCHCLLLCTKYECWKNIYVAEMVFYDHPVKSYSISFRLTVSFRLTMTLSNILTHIFMLFYTILFCWVEDTTIILLPVLESILRYFPAFFTFLGDQQQERSPSQYKSPNLLY